MATMADPWPTRDLDVANLDRSVPHHLPHIQRRDAVLSVAPGNAAALWKSAAARCQSWPTPLVLAAVGAADPQIQGNRMRKKRGLLL
jgi:hypothetical protein